MQMLSNSLIGVYGEQKIETAKIFLLVANRKHILRLPKMFLLDDQGGYTWHHKPGSVFDFKDL